MYDFNPNYALNAQSLQFGGMGLQPPALGSGSSFSPAGAVPAASGGAGFNFGLNVPTLQMGLGALNSVGNIWGAWQANRLARDQLDFTKNFANTNLNNQITSYNTALSDRARARGFTEGQSDQQVQDYISTNRMTR